MRCTKGGNHHQRLSWQLDGSEGGTPLSHRPDDGVAVREQRSTVLDVLNLAPPSDDVGLGMIRMQGNGLAASEIGVDARILADFGLFDVTNFKVIGTV